MSDTIHCCELCGRDTKNKSRICTRCYTTGSKSEEYGRKRLPPDQSALDPAEHERGEYDETPNETYHGDSIRDDI